MNIESPLLAHPLLVESLRPEVTIIVGILLLIIVPNLGNATVRIPTVSYTHLTLPTKRIV